MNFSFKIGWFIAYTPVSIIGTSSEIYELYLKRWDVELFFRDIKTTMGMGILRCQSPEMIRKEILMYFIAYNCVRKLMCEAAEKMGF
ncbi:MAG: transposase [Desulfobulbus sp.]